MNKRIGFIGTGNMGSAIISGIIGSGLVKGEDVYASDRNEKSLKALKEKFGINISTDNLKSVESADILVLSVKPDIYPIVIEEIKEDIGDTLVVTIAAGQTRKKVKDAFGRSVRLIRVMPNTPAMVREGMSLISPDESAGEEDVNDVLKIFESLGRAEVVEESLIDTAGALSGCGPAYTYMFIEALADAAVEYGVKRDMAYRLASQTVLGSAKMVLESGKHPGLLKDNVCSPGGTTIKGVAALEHSGFRSSAMKAVEASIEKSFEMSGRK